MIPRRGKFLMSSQVMTSSPVSRLNCADILDFSFPLLLFFFEGNHLTYILEKSPGDRDSPWTHTLLKILHFTCHHFKGGDSSECEKRKREKKKSGTWWEQNSRVWWTWPGIPIHQPALRNTDCMKEGEEDHLLSREKIKPSRGILKTRLKSDETQKRVIMKRMWCRIT